MTTTDQDEPAKSFPGLDGSCHGESRPAHELLPLVYDELRRLAAHKLARESPGQTLQATALVHEAYLRIVGADPARPWSGRSEFFAAAAEAMRRILVENVRHKHRLKRGGDRERVELGANEPECSKVDEDLLALDEALDALRSKDKVKADLVQLRVFGGLTLAETAQILGISTATADRYWAYARAWLRVEIAERDLKAGGGQS